MKNDLRSYVSDLPVFSILAMSPSLQLALTLTHCSIIILILVSGLACQLVEFSAVCLGLSSASRSCACVVTIWRLLPSASA